MNSDEHTHIKNLLHIHLAHLRQLETQAAKYGDLAVPPHISIQIDEYRQKAARLEEQVRARLPHHNLLPREYEQFIGRQKELVEVRRLLQSKNRAYVVTIDGIGGIGKSTLALEVAHTLRENYTNLPEVERFEVIVWVSAKRDYLTANGIIARSQAFRTLDDLFVAISQLLDYPSIMRVRVEERRAIVDRVLSEQRTLLILDNLETVDDEELLLFLREVPEPTKVIITTRHRIDVAHPVRLTYMQKEDALELIVQEAVRKNVTIETDEKEELYHRTGGVPLAIVWSIGLMGLGGSVESILRRLQGKSDITHFCFDESLSLIRGLDAQRLLFALSLFATDASRKALGIVSGLGEDEFGRDIGLEKLLLLSLVNKEGDRFSLLPLTRSYIRSEAAQPEWMKGLQERWEDYYYKYVQNIRKNSHVLQDQYDVEHELPNIIAVIHTISASVNYVQDEEGIQVISQDSVPRAKYLIDFIDTVARICRLRGYWSNCEDVCQIGILMGRHLSDFFSVAWRCFDLASINYYRGENTIARKWIYEMRQAAEKDNNSIVGTHVDRLLGLVNLDEGDVQKASDLLHSSFVNYQKSGGRNSLQNFMAALGKLAEQQGDYPVAASWYAKAVEIFRQKNDLPYIAAELLNLSRMKSAMGNITEAQEGYQESFQLAQDCGRRDVIGQALYVLAGFECTQGLWQTAESKARQALDLFRRLGMRREQAEVEALLIRISEASEN